MKRTFFRYGAIAAILTYAAVFISINYNTKLNKNINKVSASAIQTDDNSKKPVLVAEGTFFTPSVNNEGQRLLYSSGENIYEMDLSSKSTKQLTCMGNCYNPVYWCADNNIIAFARNNGVYLLDVKKNKVKEIVGSENPQISFAKPSITPEGNIIYFMVTVLPKSDGHGFTEKDPCIYKAERNGTNVEKIAEGYNPVVSKDGNKLLYEFQGNIYIMDLHTKDRRVVGTGKYAAWSNSGSFISFSETKREMIPYTKTKAFKNLFIDKEYSNIYVADMSKNNNVHKVTSEEFDNRSKEIEQWASDLKHTNIEQHFLLSSKKVFFDSTWSKDDKELYVSLFNCEKKGFELVKYKIENK